MPTGYTSDLYDGKDVSFEDFALHCARAFGAWIHQRDESMDAKPRPREVSSYVVNALASAKKNLRDWLKTTSDERYDMWRDYADETEARNREYIAETTARNARFEAMLAKVDAWDAPEGLENMKEFMREQLSYDIGKKPYTSKVRDFDEWVVDHENSLRRNVVWARERYDEEVESARKSNEFTADLYTSLGLTYDS